MSSPAVDAALRSFYDLLLICRPKNPITFAAEFFEDEKKTDPEYYHALRVLPYLCSDAKRFRSASATIFGHLLEHSQAGVGGSACSTSINTEVVKNVVVKLSNESYISPISAELRHIIDSSISIDTLGFAEFDIYLRLAVRTSVLLHAVNDLISASCACRAADSSTGLNNMSDLISAEDLLSCLSHPKVEAIIEGIPSFADGEAENRGMHHALTSVIKRVGEKKVGGSCGISATDIIKEFILST